MCDCSGRVDVGEGRCLQQHARAAFRCLEAALGWRFFLAVLADGCGGKLRPPGAEEGAAEESNSQWGGGGAACGGLVVVLGWGGGGGD